VQRRLSRVGDGSGLGGLRFLRCISRRRDPCGRHEGRDRDVRGSIAAVPWEENAHVRSPGREAIEFEASHWYDDPPKRSSGVVKTSGPLVVAARSLSLRGASAPRKWRQRARNTRGAGARSSIGWQTSVGRIARLLHWEVARPVGDQRALARKKSVAPPDAGRGWVEGETVRVRRGKQTVYSTSGFWV
jgi:hypothetical protein